MLPGGIIDANGCLKRNTNDESFNEYTRFSSELKQYGITHLNDILDYSHEKFSSQPCLGTRNILSRHRIKEGEKEIEKLSLSEYTWLNYDEVREKSIQIGNGLMNVESEPIDAVTIFAETRAEWLVAAMGCFYQRIVVVTLYSTLSDEALLHALNETEVSIMFTSYQILPRVLKLQDKCKYLKTLIIMENNFEDLRDYEREKGSLKLLKFKDLVKTGRSSKNTGKVSNRSQEDTAIIMYTSGSTGIPKGVELSHKNILASIFAYPCTMHITSKDRYLAFLPLAHIMELIAELSCIAVNIPIMYSSPTTLTSKSLRVMAGCMGDAKAGKPTFTMVVPLVLDRIIKGVQKKVSEESFIKSFVFNLAVRVKIWLRNNSFICNFLDKLIFKKVQEELGGNLKIIGVGGSPLADHTFNLMRAMFSCSLRVGYGTTETAACVSGMNWKDNSSGHVGPPNYGIYVRIYSDIVEKIKTNHGMKGDIHAGGDIIAKGYFKREKETHDYFYDKDGIRWFITGDIGEITKDGCLKIIDRKRDYIKLKHGEYVSLLKIETVLKSHVLVENACVIGNSYKENTVAILTLSLENASMFPPIHKKLCNNKGSTATLYASEEFTKMIHHEFVGYAKQMGLSKWETPVAIYITADVWSSEAGFLTGSMKIRRKFIETTYADKIKAMLKDIE